jgi:hypothetical protein
MLDCLGQVVHFCFIVFILKYVKVICCFIGESFDVVLCQNNIFYHFDMVLHPEGSAVNIHTFNETNIVRNNILDFQLLLE